MKFICACLLLSISACASNQSWPQYAAEHQCIKGNGHVWKCATPFSEWWLVEGE